ncbi:unnamed protein product [Kluyveromyces dobzhanskii CBS 2104]|uniref:WGS project CCBQ000000000 data, contig 00015 n=1 Tax=Kluyveromyces dobzhanskii CBS 2104 TaxID=1427455 RepID=A0A0A8LA10_9SACH|nr:unnamed protein product [Kluyveromyces dobzhanskii CBS 2104]
MSQLNDPAELLQQTRSNFIIDSDVSGIKQIKTNMRQLTQMMAEKRTHHDGLIKQLQTQIQKQQGKVQALRKSFQEQTTQVKRVENELNIPKLEREIDELVQETSQLRETIQEGIQKVVETQKQLLDEEADAGTSIDQQPISKEDKIRVLKLKLFHSLDLTLYNDEILDLRNEARPLSAANVWDEL